MRDAPGRACPLGYRYGASALQAAPALEADTLYVAGGLYGNPYALDALLELAADESGSRVVFNGDFNWFDIHPDDFLRINEGVLAHTALRGNVETELAMPAAGAGCGCGYPEWVGEAEVARSNRIQERLRSTAQAHPQVLARLGALPMHAVAQVGGQRVAILHGDADSLSGWGFSQEVLSTAEGAAAAARALQFGGADIAACSHTCLPVLQCLRIGSHDAVVANNGAAGMPNFRGTQFGLATRISVRGPSSGALYGTVMGGVHIEAVALRYDAAAWMRRFLEQWPPGSEAHLSYHARIASGPAYSLAEAARTGMPAPAQPALAL